MRSTRSPSWGEEGSVQNFQFDGAYAGSASPRKEDARPTKRQPKRRGLWNACFAQPRVDEPASSPPSRTSPSSLTLTAQQLAFRHRGSPETQRLPLCSIKDVQTKWIQAGGVRVSKVTITLDSGKDPVVIRGLKNPEDLVHAIKKRQMAAVEPGNRLQEAEGRQCDVPGTSPAGRWSEAAVSPSKRVMITPRALFADTPGSPASVPTSGCGSMTLMSAFARSPAQEFAGADSVAREIQLASPGHEDLSYSGSSADSMAHDVDGEGGAYVDGGPAAAAVSPPPRMPPPADTRVGAMPPPRQPSDSIAIPAPASSQLTAGLMHTQFSPRSSGYPSAHTAGGSPPPGDPPLLGGSPPPRAEDSMPEGASVPSSVQGSPHPAPPCTAGGDPPPVPEDSAVVYGAAGGDSTPVSPLSSTAPLTAGRPLSPGSCPDDQTRLEEVSFSAPRTSEAAAATTVAATAVAAFEEETPRLLLPSISRQRRHLEGGSSHRLGHSSLPSAAPFRATAGNISPDNLAGQVAQSDGGGSSFQSASSGDLTDASQSASASASPPGPSGSPALAPPAGVLSTPSDRRSTSPVGALGIAAVSATVSAVLTSAASAGLGAVGLAAASPLAGAAGGSAATAASVAAAPLTLLGLTAAAAVTLVAAAAVTHIRTGSPLRPLESPCDVDPWGAAARPEPLLSAGTRASAGQVPDSPTSWFGSHRSNTVSCGKAAGDAAPGPECSISGAAAAADAPVAVVTATGSTLGAGGEHEPTASSTSAAIGGTSLACITPAPDLAAEPSLRCDPGGPGTEAVDGGGLEEGGCPSAATGASGAAANSGDASEEDAAASGAWGSQHTLVDLDPEHATAGSGPAARAQVRPSLGGGSGGGATTAASCTGEQHQHHLEAEEEALPVMLFSEGPGGMPPLERNGGAQGEEEAAAAAHGAQDAHPQRQPAAARTVCPTEFAAPSALTAGGLEGEHAAGDGQSAAGAMHGGELHPPPQLPPVRAAAEPEPAGPNACIITAQAVDDPYQAVQPTWRSSRQPVAPWRDPTVRQLFPDEEEEPAVRATHTPHLRAAAQSAVAAIDQSSPAALVVRGLASPAAAAGAASPASRQPRTHLLTESPVRVLYSVHAAFMGLPSADPRVTHSPQWAQPTLETCESEVQTEPPVAECAVQTEAEARGSAVAAGRSRGGTMDGAGATCCSRASASAAAQPLAESAMQRVFTLNSPQESGNGCNSGSISVAAGPDGPDGGGGPSPPQAGARDWYMSSVGADAAHGGFGLVASSSVGQDRRTVPTEEPSRAWNGVSEEAKDYLRSLLSKRGPMPPVRPSAAESPSVYSPSSQPPRSSVPAAAATRSTESVSTTTTTALPQKGPRYTLALCCNSSARSRLASKEEDRLADGSAPSGDGGRGVASVAAASEATTPPPGLSTADSVRRMVEAALRSQQRQRQEQQVLQGQQLKEQQQSPPPHQPQQHQQQSQVTRLQEQQLVMQLHLPGSARTVEPPASPSQSASQPHSESESRTVSPSSVSGGSSSSVPLSASVDSGLYTPLMSDTNVSGDRDTDGNGEPATGASPPLLGHSPASSCALLLGASATSPRVSSNGADNVSDGGAAAANAAAASASPAADDGASISVIDASMGDSEMGTDPQRRLLAPGVPLSAEPLTPWTHRGSCSFNAFAASGEASSPNFNNAQDGISSAAGAGRAFGARDASTVAAEPASSSLLRSAGSDTADDMVWLLRPGAGIPRVSDDAASAPASPRIPPPPPLAHSNTASRGGSASNRSPSRRITLETEESLGGAAGCCTSRRSSVGSCSVAAAAADRASLAWHMTRVSTVHAAHTGASPALDSCSDGNQLAAPLLFSGACGLAAERGSASEHVPGPQSCAGSSDSGHSSRHSDDGSESPDSSRLADRPRSDPLGAVDLLGDAVGAVDSLEARGCSCSGDGGGSASLGAASSGSQAGSPAPHSPSGASIAASQAAAASPDLSDISPAAYAAGAYVYGSPYSSPGSDVDGGPRATGAVGSAAAGGGAGDDLFQNPLYATPGNDTAGTSPRGRPPRDRGGCIALPLMPYSESRAYTGGGASTCATTPEPTIASHQPSVASELRAGAGRRRTREEATATSSFLYDNDGLQRTAAGQYGTGAADPRRAADAGAASRLGSADGGGSRPHGEAPDWAAFAPEGSAAAGSGGGSAEVQPQKRARMLMPHPEEAVGQQAHAEQLPSTPAPPGAGGCAAPVPRGLPLVSPFMVLNPTYAGSTGGSPAVTSSPPTAAQSDDVLALRADAVPRHCLADAEWTPHWDVAVAKPEAAGRMGGGGDCTALSGALELMDQHCALQTTPRNRELVQLQSSELGSLQGSPSSQQALHAATLLRHANDAVDFARDAVQRGDAEWLSRVTATLQAVQSALDALREF